MSVQVRIASVTGPRVRVQRAVPEWLDRRDKVSSVTFLLKVAAELVHDLVYRVGDVV